MNYSSKKDVNIQATAIASCEIAVNSDAFFSMDSPKVTSLNKQTN